MQVITIKIHILIVAQLIDPNLEDSVEKHHVLLPNFFFCGFNLNK
jgi:hypothetical protein